MSTDMCVRTRLNHAAPMKQSKKIRSVICPAVMTPRDKNSMLLCEIKTRLEITDRYSIMDTNGHVYTSTYGCLCNVRYNYGIARIWFIWSVYFRASWRSLSWTSVPCAVITMIMFIIRLEILYKRLCVIMLLDRDDLGKWRNHMRLLSPAGRRYSTCVKESTERVRSVQSGTRWCTVRFMLKSSLCLTRSYKSSSTGCSSHVHMNALALICAVHLQGPHSLTLLITNTHL